MSGNKGRNQPRKGHVSTGEFFALGSKSGPSKPPLRLSEEAKQASTKPGLLGQPPTKKLRPAPPTEGPSSSGGLFSDPIRMSQVQGSQGGGGGKGQTSSSLGKGQSSSSGVKGQSGSATKPAHAGSTTSQVQVIEVRPGELLPAMAEAKSAGGGGGESKVVRILAGAMKQLKHSRLKPDAKLNGDLVSLVKDDSQLFNNPNIIEGLVTILKREPSIIFKAKSNPSVYILATQLLLLALQHSYDWPETIGKAFIEDSVGDRVWVDLEQCKKLVDNICVTFQTKSSPSSGAGPGGGESGGSSGKPSAGGGGEAAVASASGGGGEKADSEALQTLIDEVDIEPRFSLSTCKSLKSHILQLISDVFSRHAHPPDSVSRNLLRFLTTVAGYPEVRVLVAQKMEAWIQNPKLGKHCQELLMGVATNCSSHQSDDLKVIESLLAIRLKTKLFSNQFVGCIRELISSHPGNLETVLRGVVNNELGQLRSPSNIALLAMMMHYWPSEAPKLLGTVFQEFLTRKEDYLRALRGFLREIVRQVRNEFNFYSFAWSLMQKMEQFDLQQLEPLHKERMALSIADLVSCSCMLMANMLIREAYAGYQKGEKAMLPQLQEFFTTLGVIQRDGVWWVHTVVAEVYRPQPLDYKLCLRKVLFLEGAEVYSSKDNWPPETDRSLILHLMGEACLKEDTLMRVLIIGLKRDLPLSPADSLDIADRLVARAASAHTDDIPRLPVVERRELFNVIFDITTYRPPPNIQLPDDYDPPSLAISKLYWKGWILLLVLTAFNPKSIGSLGWSEYPPLKGMMEMVMTSNYSFPPSMALSTREDSSLESRDSALMREMQVSRAEREAILEYENHLAASSSQPNVITESNSFLLNQVTLLRPKGPVRRLPGTVIDLIKTVNRLKLGQLLCRCRSPDFLLDIIRRQGTVESMKWLTELMESSQSSLEVLPVPCLCEFLMSSYKEQGEGVVGEADTDPSSHRPRYKRRKTAHDKVSERQKQLVRQLHSLLVGPQATPEKTGEVLEYFFEKLTGSSLTPRRLALKSLQFILSKGAVSGQAESDVSDTDEEENRMEGREDRWLMKQLPTLPHFSAVLPKISHLLLQACLMETNLRNLQTYVLFITSHIPRDLIFEFSIGISQIVVDRFTIIKRVFRMERSSGGEGEGRKGAEAMHGALLSMLRVSLETAIHSQRIPQVSDSSDFVLVTFPSGKKTILHTALIHATLLLLTCPPPPSPPASGDFQFLSELWLPTGDKFPEAHTVEDKEGTPLISGTILPEMMLSQNPSVVGLCLRDAGVSELCSSVQQFGIPEATMRQILTHLDSVCNSEEQQEQCADLEKAVKNPVKLAQFAEVQFVRCRQENGRAFLSFVRNLGGVPDDPVQSVSEMLLSGGETQEVEMAPVSPSAEEKWSLDQLSEERAEQVLMKSFAPSVGRSSFPTEEATKVASDIEKGLRRLIQSAAAAPGDSGEREALTVPARPVLVALHKVVVKCTGRTRRQVLDGMTKSSFAVSLLRLLTRIKLLRGSEGAADTELLKATVKQISDSLATMKFGKVKELPRFLAVVKACSTQLGLKTVPERESYSEKVAKVAEDCASGIRGEGDLFSQEQAKMIGDICHFVGTEKQSPHVEGVLSALVHRSIDSGMEGKCIDLLQRLSWRCRPIALYHSPEIFHGVHVERKSEKLRPGRPEVGEKERRGRVTSSHPPFVHSLDMSGLKVDLLEMLDPEILNVTPEVTGREVFGWSALGREREEGEEERGWLGPGYLLARLVHESSWETLHQTVTSLLTEEHSLDEEINCSAVLDFLWACLHKPVLWQGCVGREAIENSNLSLGIDESELTLTLSQLKCLLDCILGEASQWTAVGGRDGDRGEGGSALYSRLPLLVSCYRGNKDALETVVRHLTSHKRYPALARQLLVQLYHTDERVLLFHDRGTFLKSLLSPSPSIPCRLDTELHHLVSAMCDAKAGQESVARMTSAALVCRRVAFQHPTLFLRQLPLLGWLLRGRAHLNYSEFRNRNHKHVFQNSLFLLHLLQPLVFHESQNQAMEVCLQPFFDFLKNQCVESRRHQSTVLSFSDFLVLYAQHNKTTAAPLIHHHLTLLQSLADIYSTKKSSLRSLVDCFPPEPEESQWGQQAIPGPPLGVQIMMVPPSVVGHSLTHEQVMPFLKKLEQGQLREDVLKVLQDLEETSLHSVEILRHFVPELCRIIRDPEPTSCALAHSLLLRHLKETPSAVKDIVPTYLSCLKSHDHSVVMATVGVVPELVLLCESRDAGRLLEWLFSLSTHSFMNCTSHLLQAVEACTSHRCPY